MMTGFLRTIAAAACVAFTAMPAAALTITDLVEERAMEEVGAEIPADAEFKVKLSGQEDAEAVVINDWWMDPASGKFLANVVLEEGSITRVSGVAIVAVEVPVPARRLSAGAIIAENDLETRSLPAGRVGSYAVLEADDLVGMQVQRVLMRGRAVQEQSISPPIIIQRGEIVTISYQNEGLDLSAKGKALAAGFKGQDVRVVNLVSNKTLVGVASKEGIVEVIR
ncbi:flagellar basal body P-ring formation chaperone FlgA [Salipiger mucosus]|uniref:Flagella basal body P-ring formation protein FlgA n=1 Tax=Salipiger mucosus DSM 16094 TaxID=1123237 RepID=S9Q9J8_9RHOB|nr:flagellar basal body P-ring formation chaperone FlgA [Salipiger mucosus]EPX78036.1 hypothetical protein Salmuc_03358 [Salipiger mucosus DSM 16094]